MFFCCSAYLVVSRGVSHFSSTSSIFPLLLLPSLICLGWPVVFLPHFSLRLPPLPSGFLLFLWIQRCANPPEEARGKGLLPIKALPKPQKAASESLQTMSKSIGQLQYRETWLWETCKAFLRVGIIDQWISCNWDFDGWFKCWLHLKYHQRLVCSINTIIMEIKTQSG